MKHEHDTLNDTLRISVPGDVVSTTTPALRTELFQLLDQELAEGKAAWRTLNIDLSPAQMIDSVGLNFLVAVIRKIKENGRKVACVISSKHVHRTMTFTRLDSMMQIELRDAA